MDDEGRSDMDDKEPTDRSQRERDAKQQGAEVAEAELVRYLDGELSGEARASLEARIAEQPEASARLAVLRRRSAGLSALLAELNPTAAGVLGSAQRVRPRITSHGARRPAWFSFTPVAVRIAAAILLVFVIGSAAVPPARAWVLDRVREVAAALGLFDPARAVHSPEATAAEGQPGAAVGASFPVAPDTFHVHVLSARGELIIRRSSGESAFFEARNAPGADPVLGSRGIRLDGSAAADAIYLLALPHSVPAVQITNDAGETVTQPLPSPGEELRIPLHGG